MFVSFRFATCVRRGIENLYLKTRGSLAAAIPTAPSGMIETLRSCVGCLSSLDERLQGNRVGFRYRIIVRVKVRDDTRRF